MESRFFYFFFYVCLIAFLPYAPFREKKITSICLDKKNITENISLSSRNNGNGKTITKQRKPEITYVETDMAPV